MRRMPRLFSMVFSVIALAPFEGLWAEGEANPQVEKLGSAVLLYVNFDNETTDAEMATVEGKDQAPLKGNHKFVKGVYGKGFVPGEKGLPQYVLKESGITFGNPGGAFIWVSPQGWDREKPEEYVFFLRFNAENGQIILAKSNMQGRSDRLYVYAKGGNSEKGASVSAGSTEEWLNDEWHLLAVNWGSDWVAISVDGKEFVQLEVPELQNYGALERVILGSVPVPHRAVVYDEFVLLSRPLSNDEILEIYNSGNPANRK